MHLGSFCQESKQPKPAVQSFSKALELCKTLEGLAMRIRGSTPSVLPRPLHLGAERLPAKASGLHGRGGGQGTVPDAPQYANPHCSPSQSASIYQHAKVSWLYSCQRMGLFFRGSRRWIKIGCTEKKLVCLWINLDGLGTILGFDGFNLAELVR
jgi:hypothetical protein